MLTHRKLDRRDRPTLLPVAVAAALLAAAAVANAQAPAPAGNGVMSFPNVRVVYAPVPAASAPDAGTTGLRAFVDPSTGQLMEPTREQVEELMAQPLRLGARRMTGALQMFGLPSGGVGVRLDESFMSYSVARRTDGGGLAMACVPGEELAQAWLARDPAAIARTGTGGSQ